MRRVPTSEGPASLDDVPVGEAVLGVYRQMFAAPAGGAGDGEECQDFNFYKTLTVPSSKVAGLLRPEATALARATAAPSWPPSRR